MYDIGLQLSYPFLETNRAETNPKLLMKYYKNKPISKRF